MVFNSAFKGLKCETLRRGRDGCGDVAIMLPRN